MIALNRAVAVAMAESPERGLAEIDRIEGLDDYLHLHSARGDLLERAGRAAEAARPSAAHSGSPPARSSARFSSGDSPRSIRLKRVRRAQYERGRPSECSATYLFLSKLLFAWPR